MHFSSDRDNNLIDAPLVYIEMSKYYSPLHLQQHDHGMQSNNQFCQLERNKFRANKYLHAGPVGQAVSINA
jgi:hypothetical protein